MPPPTSIPAKSGFTEDTRDFNKLLLPGHSRCKVIHRISTILCTNFHMLQSIEYLIVKVGGCDREF